MKKKSKLPRVKGIWTVDDKLGGWAATQKHFFDEKVCWCKLLFSLFKGKIGVILLRCSYVWSAAASAAEFA